MPHPSSHRSRRASRSRNAVFLASTLAAGLTFASRPATAATRRSPRSDHAATSATVGKFRRDAFASYDESPRRTLGYGNGGHPWERLAATRSASGTAAEKAAADEDWATRRRTSGGTMGGGDTIGIGGGLNASTIAYALEGGRRHEPLRIQFLTTALESARGESDEKDRKITLIEERVLPGIADVWSRSLAVVPVADVVTVRRNACFGLVDLGENVDVFDADVVVIVDVAANEELACVDGGNNALAVATPCEADQYDRPIIGFINFCLEKSAGIDGDEYDDFLVGEDEVAQFVSVGTHEVGHVLGMAGDLVKYFRDAETGVPLTDRPLRRQQVTCLDGAVRSEYRPSTSILGEGTTSNGARYFEVTTPRLATVVRNHFNCPSAKGARLENQPTSQSCFGSHFDERLFFTELMGPVYSSFSNELSPVTLAYFEDSGWYVSNYSSSSPSTFGHGAGCDFIYKNCIQDGQVPDYSKGFFCNQEIFIDPSGDFQVEGITCDPSRTHKAICDLAPRDEIDGLPVTNIPAQWQYFPEDGDLGAFSMWLADFCPIASIDYMDCQDATFNLDGEYFGLDSRCYDVQTFGALGARFISLCFKTKCNAETNVIEVGVRDVTFVCDYDGQVHSLSSVLGNASLECPRFAVVCPHLVCPNNCAGRGTCNWDADGGPRCECFDESDRSPGCDSSAGTPNPAVVGSAQSAPSPSVAPQSAMGGSSTPAPTWMVPNTVFRTQPPVYDGPIIVLGPQDLEDTSAAYRKLTSLLLAFVMGAHAVAALAFLR